MDFQASTLQDNDRREKDLVRDEIVQLFSLAKKIFDHPESSETELVQATLDFLNEHFGRLNEINRQIWSTIHDIEVLRKDRAKHNTLALEVRLTICKLQKLIVKKEALATAAASTTPGASESTPVNNRRTCCDTKNLRRLEPLTMDKLDGKLENWLPWWNRFEDRIHRDEELNDRTKHDFLLQYLTKKVKERLKTIPIDGEFYETALNRLNSEFGNVDKL